jgi:hypothetical protein
MTAEPIGEGALSLPSLSEAARYRRVPLSRTGVGHFEAAGTLGGHAVRVTTDTGGAATVAHLTRAKELGLEVGPLDRCGAGRAGVVLGVDAFEAQAAVIDYGSASLFLQEH